MSEEVERLAKLPFTSTSDEKHLEQLKQEIREIRAEGPKAP